MSGHLKLKKFSAKVLYFSIVMYFGDDQSKVGKGLWDLLYGECFFLF